MTRRDVEFFMLGAACSLLMHDLQVGAWWAAFGMLCAGVAIIGLMLRDKR